MTGFAFADLLYQYSSGTSTVSDVINDVLARIEEAGDDHVWISRASDDVVRARAVELQTLLEADAESLRRLPLFGIPFAVKDSIDVLGMETTAACPAFTYRPTKSAPVVDKLIAAGAILIGKTNLDQFASGLVGVRSPYGVSRNPFDARFIPGGSSSGSAVAVSSGLVSFAIATDAAGSGRVPAALNNIVGLKPTRGLVSKLGTVPACQSIDCISVMALSCADAWQLLEVIAEYDEQDPYSRPWPVREARPIADGFRFGVPHAIDLIFDGDQAAAFLYQEAVELLQRLGGTKVEIDYTPFRETAELLYGGPWVADRLGPLKEFVDAQPEAIHPITRQILTSGRGFDAVDAFEEVAKVKALERRAGQVMRSVDALVLPTTPTTYTIDEVLADPLGRNARLGYYANFVNLLDLSAIAVPNGFRPDGLPLGITLIGRAYDDATIALLGAHFHRARQTSVDDNQRSSLPADSAPIIVRQATDTMEVAVVGAHLAGQPRNRELTRLSARLICETRTAPKYRLMALREPHPRRPALVRVDPSHGAAIEAEVWAIPSQMFGQFVAGIPAPLAIGTVELEDGREVKGFVCEPIGTDGAQDITEYGSWRAYLQASISN